MTEKVFWGFSWLAMIVLLSQPLMADIIQPAKTEHTSSDSEQAIQSRPDNLQGAPSVKVPLNMEEQRYLAAAPQRMQTVAGLTTEETVWGIIMLTGGIVGAVIVSHQLTK